MVKFIRSALPLALVALLAACSKEKPSADVPLAFVPADTPYVFANLEPVPKPVIDEWSTQMQQIWPMIFDMYSRLLDKAPGMDEGGKRVAKAILDELKVTDSIAKLNENLGIKADTHMAMYGIGLVPVMRVELGDAAKFRAAIARIEAKSGAKLATAKVGDQEYWQLGTDKLVGLMAISGNHLVLTVAPAAASEELRKQLLGITRPSQSMLASDGIAKLNAQRGYGPNGSGYVDLVRLVERITSEPDAAQREFATALGSPLKGTDAVCRDEFLAIARKAPRVAFGYTELTAKRMAVDATLELEASLAKEVIDASGSAPGSAGPSEGVVDMSIALPMLKLKSFWLKQANAVAAKPYACADLAEINRSFTEMKSKLDTTIPPPLSDLTGARFVLSKLALDNPQKPDYSGKLLVGLSNPMSALAMAQLTVPALKDVKLAADGKPVTLPVGTVPGQNLPMFAAMNDKSLAIAAGAGEDATLAAFLAAPAAPEPVFLRMTMSGKIYGLMGKFAGVARAAMPAEQQADFDAQMAMFTVYEKWIRSAEIRLTATPAGVTMREVIELN